MSKIHILESDGNFGYKVAIHFPTPAGNNATGISWKSCAIQNGSIGATALSVGTEPANITQAEYDSILSGNTVEIIKTIDVGINPSNASVGHLVDICINEWETSMAKTLKYYGHTIEGA
jgi:hypothetical protein